MQHVFLLLVYLGTGDLRKIVSGDMYFASINDCQYYASRISQTHGNYRYRDFIDPKDRVTAYCLPKLIEKGSVEVY